MSRKIELTSEQIKECLNLYNEKLLGSSTISNLMGIHKTIILRTLKENGVVFGPSGRRYIGGKSASDKRNYHKHKNKKSNYHKIWAKNNRNSLRKYHEVWREENKEQVNKYKRDYERKRRAENPKYRLGIRTRTAVWQLLKERNIKKTNKTFELLGYTIEELMVHLEKQFTDGMTWDNYGKWHVDHIIPMTKFNFTSVEDNEFKLCWSLTNLQPLWAKDNLSKGIRSDFK